MIYSNLNSNPFVTPPSSPYWNRVPRDPGSHPTLRGWYPPRGDLGRRRLSGAAVTRVARLPSHRRPLGGLGFGQTRLRRLLGDLPTPGRNQNTSFARGGSGSGQDGGARRRTPSTLSVPETESVQLGSAASPNPSSVRRRLLRKPLGSRDLTQVGLPALGPSIPSDDLVHTFTDISWRADEGSRP